MFAYNLNQFSVDQVRMFQQYQSMLAMMNGMQGNMQGNMQENVSNNITELTEEQIMKRREKRRLKKKRQKENKKNKNDMVALSYEPNTSWGIITTALTDQTTDESKQWNEELGC